MTTMTIRTRILALCGGLLAVTAIIAGLGIHRLGAGNDELAAIVHGSAVASRRSVELRVHIIRLARSERDLLLADSDKLRKVASDGTDRIFLQRDEARSDLRALGDPAIASKLDQLDTVLREHDEVHKQVRALKAKASVERAAVLFATEGARQADRVTVSLGALDAALARHPLSPAVVAARLAAWQARLSASALRENDEALILATTDAAVAAVADQLTAHAAELDKALAELGAAAASPSEHELVNEARAGSLALAQVRAKGTELVRDHADRDATTLAMTRGAALTAIALQLTDDITSIEDTALAAAVTAADAADATSRELLLGALTLGVVCGGALAFALVRYISTALTASARLAGSVASGDLTRTLGVTRGDEIGTLVTALNDMVENLRRVSGEISAAATSVASGSAQITATAAQVADGAAHQSAAAEQTTSAMAEMSASVQTNVDGAVQTDQLASRASGDAQVSTSVFGEALSAMKDIAGKIAVIEDISRKTDLLALNAAVEAARAGAHGEGFSVVASEVRKLAERSATAAAEISRLSRNGVTVADCANRMLADLAPDIRSTAKLVQEVAVASREQSTGIAQTNQALTDLNGVTQQNSAAAEQLAATAGELADQARHLQIAVSFFQRTSDA